MKNVLSTEGLALIQELESFQATPKPLPTGGWVVGYGHVRVTEPGDAVNESDAAEMLARDLAPFQDLVNTLAAQPLTQSQFDALVSFAFSVGPQAFSNSQVLRRVNVGNFVAAACALDAWRKSDVSGELAVVDSLVRRRAIEKALFLKHLPHMAAPSPFVRAQLDHAASVLGAPMQCAPAPEVGTIAPPLPKPEPAVRLSEILKSEPATEALLLTQVANDTVDLEGEIITAHAKPVAREEFKPPVAQRRAERVSAQPQRKAPLAEPRPNASSGLGLAALMLFGLALVVTGASLLILGVRDFAGYAGAAALAAPGLTAVLMAAFGLWRTPREKPIAVANA